jgi:general secretion pathway protein A
MYKDFFRLNEIPFSIAPDPRFLFMSERHCEAMAHLKYGIGGEGGIVLLTGEVGTGKTTICRSLIEQLPDNIDVAFIFNPKMNAVELLQTICEEFHIEVAHPNPGAKTYIDALNSKLLANHALGHRAILIVDEAQNLSAEVLEQLRLLTNLETNSRKLLQIFLIGQPELQDMLSRPEMRQVSQRVVARYNLTHLNPAEVSSYIAHRLRIAGASPLIFPETLVQEVCRASGGVPRLINLICDRALLGAYVQDKEQVTLPILRRSIEEIIPVSQRSNGSRVIIAGISILFAAAVILFLTKLAGDEINPARPWLALMSSRIDTVPTVTVIPASAIPASPVTPVLSAVVATTTLQPPRWLDRVGSEPLAFQSLFKLYGIEIDINSKESACQQAEVLGMRCYSAQGGLSDLRQLDQPVLLRLSSAEGMEYAASLSALDHQTAKLTVSGSEQHVMLSDLAQAWHGLYVAVWRSPPGSNGMMAVGHRGADVIWLRQALSVVDGIADSGSNFFDLELEKRIRAFQLAEGIQPDGQVGPLTLIRINMRNGDVLPHLITEKKG